MGMQKTVWATIRGGWLLLVLVTVAAARGADEPVTPKKPDAAIVQFHKAVRLWQRRLKTADLDQIEPWEPFADDRPLTPRGRERMLTASRHYRNVQKQALEALKKLEVPPSESARAVHASFLHSLSLMIPFRAEYERQVFALLPRSGRVSPAVKAKIRKLDKQIPKAALDAGEAENQAWWKFCEEYDLEDLLPPL